MFGFTAAVFVPGMLGIGIPVEFPTLSEPVDPALAVAATG